MKNKSKIISFILVFSLLLCLFGCRGEKKPQNGQSPSEGTTAEGAENKDSQSGENKTETEKNVIKIGVLDTVSGPYGENGKLQLLGLKYANFKKPRIKVGEKKFDIELLFSEKIENRSDAKKEARKLIKNGVSAVIGSFNGAFSLSAAGIFEESGIPFVNVSSSPLKLTEDFKNVFTLSKSDEYTGAKLADLLFKKLGKTSAFVLCPLGDDSAEEQAFFFAQRLRSLGGKAKIKTFDLSEADFSKFTSEAAKYDALFVSSPLSRCGQIISSAAGSGVKTILSTSLWNSEKLFFELRNVFVDLYLCTNLKYNERSERCVDFMNWMGSDAELSTMSGGSVESGIAYGAVDAYNLILSSIKSAGSVSTAKIIKAISFFNGKGITGNISFDETGARDQAAAIFHFNNTLSSWEKIT